MKLYNEISLELSLEFPLYNILFEFHTSEQRYNSRLSTIVELITNGSQLREFITFLLQLLLGSTLFYQFNSLYSLNIFECLLKSV